MTAAETCALKEDRLIYLETTSWAATACSPPRRRPPSQRAIGRRAKTPFRTSRRPSSCSRPRHLRRLRAVGQPRSLPEGCIGCSPAPDCSKSSASEQARRRPLYRARSWARRKAVSSAPSRATWIWSSGRYGDRLSRASRELNTHLRVLETVLLRIKREAAVVVFD